MSDEPSLNEINSRVRAAIDNALEEQTYTQRWDGHVSLVDGDVDTGDIAQAAVEAVFVYLNEWVATQFSEVADAFIGIPGLSQAIQAAAVAGEQPQ